MSEGFQIGQTFRRVVAQDRKFPYKNYEDEDSSFIMPAINFLENCFSDSVLVLCKIKHPEVAYVSRNCEAILGYTSQYLKSTSPEEYFNLVHPDDQSSVRRLYERMELHTKSKDYLPEKWKFAFNYRLRSKEGKYIYIQDEKAAFLHTSNQYVHYSVLTTREEMGALNTPFMILSKRFKLSFRQVDRYVPKSSTEILTPREKQILQYLDAGMSTKEMAKAISLSPFTIRNHKTSLLRKTKAKTSLQAIRNARKLNWI